MNNIRLVLIWIWTMLFPRYNSYSNMSICRMNVFHAFTSSLPSAQSSTPSRHSLLGDSRSPNSFPMTYIFEGMRTIINKGIFSCDLLFKSLWLNLTYLTLMAILLKLFIEKSREKGSAASNKLEDRFMCSTHFLPPSVS
jgi:hypothetical protein